VTTEGSGKNTSESGPPAPRAPARPADPPVIPRQHGARSVPDGPQWLPDTGTATDTGTADGIGADVGASAAVTAGAPADVDGGPGRGGGTDGTDAAGGRPGGRHRWLVAGLALAFVVVVGLIGWVGVRGLLARAQLEQARSRIAALQHELMTGDFPSEGDLRARIADIGRQARAARSLTGDPVWAAFGHAPWAGCPLRSAASLMRAVDTMTAAGLPAVADLSTTLNPTRLRHQMTIDVAALAGARAPAQRAAAALDALRDVAERTQSCGRLGQVTGIADARTELVDRGGKLADALANITLAARIGPDMLGAAGPRRYLLIVQNPAESRANGGIIGGFGLLTAERGRLSLTDISGNGSLPGGPTLGAPVAAMSRPFAARYGAFWPNRVWANANLTPDYPTAARFYSAMYRSGAGIAVDGTISLDPTTMAYLLAGSRPAVLPGGQVISAGNLVDLVESQVYARVPTVQERDRFFAQVGQAVYTSLESGGTDTITLLTAMAQAVREGRLTVSSNHADEQDVISSTALGGALPTRDGPYLAVVTQNATASKLDYWLRRRTSYSVQRLPSGAGAATIVVRLTNAAPAGLTAYVRNRDDEPRSDGNPNAQNNIWLSVYTGRDSLFAGARLDGQPVGLTSATENGLPVVSTYLTIDRGQTRTLELKVLEPQAGPALAVRPQPLPVPERLVVEGVPVTSPWSRRVRK